MRARRFQIEMSKALTAMGIEHAVEAAVEHEVLGPVTVDILIKPPGGAPIAVEVDGPTHFTALPPFRNLGHTVLRNRLLEARSGLNRLLHHAWPLLSTPSPTPVAL
jgi:hypothetical protein